MARFLQVLHNKELASVWILANLYHLRTFMSADKFLRMFLSRLSPLFLLGYSYHYRLSPDRLQRKQTHTDVIVIILALIPFLFLPVETQTPICKRRKGRPWGYQRLGVWRWWIVVREDVVVMGEVVVVDEE